MGRASNYELARVIAMLQIVYFHFSINTSWGINEHPKDDDGNELPYVMPMRQFLLILAESFGKTGVQLFMIMSGYFLGAKPASMSTILRTWFRVISYCWIIPFLCHFIQDRKMNNEDWMRALFPILTCHYWFATTYLLTMFLSPMLCRVVQQLNVREYAGILAILLFGQSMSIYWKYTHRLKEYSYSPWFWFVYLYLAGAFVRVHAKHLPKLRARGYALSLSVLVMFDVGSIYYFKTHPEMQWLKDQGSWGGVLTFVRADNSLLSFFMAMNIFLLCGQLSFESNIVNWLAQMTFSVYLIHDHYMIRDAIWKKWVRAQRSYDTPYFFLVFFIAPLPVYMICTCLEALRQKVFAKAETYVCNNLAVFLQSVGAVTTRVLGLEDDKEEASLPLTSRV